MSVFYFGCSSPTITEDSGVNDTVVDVNDVGKVDSETALPVDVLADSGLFFEVLHHDLENQDDEGLFEDAEADVDSGPESGTDLGSDILAPPPELCKEVGSPCEVHYTETQECSASGETAEVSCHKYGVCELLGENEACSFGPLSWCVDPCDILEPSPESCLTSRGQRYGVHIDPKLEGGNPSPEELQKAGIRWVRIVFKDPQTTADASITRLDYYEDIIDAHHSVGIRVLLVLNHKSVPGHPTSIASIQSWAVYRAKFIERVSQIAEHFENKVDAWQVWNGPDQETPTTAGATAHVPAISFGPIASQSYNAIKNHSEMPIVLGGFATGNTNYVLTVIGAAAGNGPMPFDALGVNPYLKQAPAGWPDVNWGSGPMDSTLNAYKNVASGKPVWITEVGCEDTLYQSDYVTNVFVMVEQVFEETIPRVFWFAWSDAIASPYGLVYSDGSSKSTYFSYQQKAIAASDECQ